MKIKLIHRKSQGAPRWSDRRKERNCVVTPDFSMDEMAQQKCVSFRLRNCRLHSSYTKSLLHYGNLQYTAFHFAFDHAKVYYTHLHTKIIHTVIELIEVIFNHIMFKSYSSKYMYMHICIHLLIIIDPPFLYSYIFSISVFLFFRTGFLWPLS